MLNVTYFRLLLFPFQGRLSPLPTGYKAEFERRAEKLLNWLDSKIEAIELVTMNTTGGVHSDAVATGGSNESSNNPSKVIEQINTELPEAKENMEVVNSLGERYRKDLSRGRYKINQIF